MYLLYRIILIDRIKGFYWDITTEVKAKLEGGDEGVKEQQRQQKGENIKGNFDEIQVFEQINIDL